MVESRCGILCSKCQFLKDGVCEGCLKITKPFWGDVCVIKQSCETKGHDHCGQCSSFPCAQLTAFSYDQKQGDDGKRIRQCEAWKKEESNL